MGWIRKNDVLKRIDPASLNSKLLCALQTQHKLVISTDNDTAVSFLHDFQKLVDEYFISGNGLIDEKRFKPELETAINDLCAVVGGDLGNEECSINFEVTPTLSVCTTEGDKHPFAQTLLRGFKNTGYRNVV